MFRLAILVGLFRIAMVTATSVSYLVQPLSGGPEIQTRIETYSLDTKNFTVTIPNTCFQSRGGEAAPIAIYPPTGDLFTFCNTIVNGSAIVKMSPGSNETSVVIWRIPMPGQNVLLLEALTPTSFYLLTSSVGGNGPVFGQQNTTVWLVTDTAPPTMITSTAQDGFRIASMKYSYGRLWCLARGGVILSWIDSAPRRAQLPVPVRGIVPAPTNLAFQLISPTNMWVLVQNSSTSPGSITTGGLYLQNYNFNANDNIWVSGVRVVFPDRTLPPSYIHYTDEEPETLIGSSSTQITQYIIQSDISKGIMASPIARAPLGLMYRGVVVGPTPNRTATPSLSPRSTQSPTATSSGTISGTNTPSSSSSSSLSPTSSPSLSPSRTPTSSPTTTATPTPSGSTTGTPTQTPSQTPSETSSPTSSISLFLSASETASETPSEPESPSETHTAGPSGEPLPDSVSETLSETPSQTSSHTQTPTPTMTRSKSTTQTQTQLLRPTASPTPTPTPQVQPPLPNQVFSGSSEPPGSGLSVGLGVGLGLPITLGVIALTAFFWRRLKAPQKRILPTYTLPRTPLQRSHSTPSLSRIDRVTVMSINPVALQDLNEKRTLSLRSVPEGQTTTVARRSFPAVQVRDLSQRDVGAVV
jgi:hypothetical protein